MTLRLLDDSVADEDIATVLSIATSEFDGTCVDGPMNQLVAQLMQLLVFLAPTSASSPRCEVRATPSGAGCRMRSSSTVRHMYFVFSDFYFLLALLVGMLQARGRDDGSY